MNRSLSMGAALSIGFLVIALFVPPASAGAKGQPSCEAIEKACLARVAKMKKFANASASSSELKADPNDLSDNRCYDSYASAQKTGIWPAYKETPAVGCSN